MQVRTALLASWLWAVGACGGEPRPVEPAPRVQPAPPVAAAAVPPPVNPAPPPRAAQPPVVVAVPAAPDPRTTAPASAEEAIATMAVFRDDMCLCTTKACADEVTDALTRWGQLVARRQPQLDQPITTEHTQRMATVVESITKCMTTAMTAGLAPGGPAGATPAAPGSAASGPSAPHNVEPTALDAYRVAGTKNVVPDDDVKRAFAKSGKVQLVTSYKLCIDRGGEVTTIHTLKPSGYPSYDAKIQRAIHGWRYRPFTVDGAPAAVCTAVTFIYTQGAQGAHGAQGAQGAPPPPPPPPAP